TPRPPHSLRDALPISEKTARRKAGEQTAIKHQVVQVALRLLRQLAHHRVAGRAEGTAADQRTEHCCQLRPTGNALLARLDKIQRSEEHTSELQSREKL